MALPFTGDPQFFVCRGIQFFPLALLVGAVYLKQRRLLLLMVVHASLDVTAGLTVGLLPALAA